MYRTLVKRISALALTLCIGLTAVFIAAPGVEAAGNLTGIGLAEFGLKAYRDGWVYNYGSKGEFNKNGQRQSDCSGLIYAYLCWKDDNSNPVDNYSMPRTVTQQANSAIASGPISTLPRTHGLILTVPNYDHVGIYLGNDKSVDNSDYATNMRYRTVSQYSRWIQWHKLGSVTYPSKGWYEFDGDPFYYENGEYVVSTSRTIGGVDYTFDATGSPSPMPDGFEPGDGGSDGSTPEDNVSIAAKTTANVNLRPAPSTNNNPIRILNAGTPVTIINNDNPNWFKIRLSDKTVGYISSQYLSTGGSNTEPTPKPSESPTLDIKAATTANVRLRQKASTDSATLEIVASGTSLTIIEKTNASWYKVKLSGGKTGYMYASYVKEATAATPKPTAKPTAKPTTKPVSIAATVTADGVNFRKSAAGTVIKSLGKGTKLTITSKADKPWYKVKLSDGAEGYIHSDYVKETASAATPKPTTKPVSISATVTANDVNFRKTAGGAVIKSLSKGTKVTITDKSNKSWYKVKLSDGTTGYISPDYLSVSAAATPKPTAKPVSIAATTTADVNLRKGAGTNYGSLDVVSKGSKITITSKANKTWYKVKLSNGKTGYMHSDYIKEGAASSGGGSSTSIKATTTAAVHLRNGAGASHSSLAVVSKGTAITITSKANKTWYKVKLSSGKTGYMHSDYIKEGSASGGTTTAKTATTTAALRLRKTASSSGSIISVMPQGAKVTLVDTSNKSWYKVKTSGGVTGYASSAYLK